MGRSVVIISRDEEIVRNNQSLRDKGDHVTT
jgi:hypothetical protein